MNRTLSSIKTWVIIVCFLFLSFSPASASEPEGLIPSIEIITHGMKRSIDISQTQNFPLDFNQHLILALGYGYMSILLSNIDQKDSNFIVLTGVSISSAGIIPFFTSGVTNVVLRTFVDIGEENFPYGLVWFSSWIYSLSDDPASDTDNPPYKYNLTLTLEEDEIEWKE